MKFSIIVPIYNVEKYLAKCIDSILAQTYQDYEVLLINDGTKDNSQSIIDKYVKEYPDKVKGFIKENGGLSDARNYGIERASGDYILFVDSDDYVAPKLLESIYHEISLYNNLDVIGYNLVDVNEKCERIGVTKKPEFHNLTGENAIIELVNGKQYFEPACGFAYRLEFWKKNKFKYIKGIYHEDFALTPIVILSAERASMLDFEGYFYMQTQNSITRNNSFEKKKKSAEDLFKGYDYLKGEVDKLNFEDNYAKKMFMAYISNAVIYRLDNQNKELKEYYRKEAKKRKLVQNVVDDTLKRKLRKLMIRIRYKI